MARIAAETIPGTRELVLLTERDSPLMHLDLGDRSIPVALAGDGLQTLLRLSLELMTAPGGAVLVEEPEVHQHPRAIGQTAGAVWGAVRRGIQVILSTHSLELIDRLLTEAVDDAELDKLSVYGLRLKDGVLIHFRSSGTEAAFARSTIEEDLR